MKEFNKDKQKKFNPNIDEAEEKEINFLTDEEFDSLIEDLNGYEIAPLEENQIQDTIRILNDYMPKRQSENVKLQCESLGFIERIKIALSYWGKWHIILSLLIYIFALYAIFTSRQASPYGVTMILSPIPFLIGLLDVFRTQEEGMQELEMSFKINFKQWILAKLFVIATFNTGLNLFYSLILSFMNLTDSFLRLTLYWCAPFLIISAIGLFIAIKIRGTYPTLVVLGTWSTIAMYVFTDEVIIKWLINLNITIYGVFILACAILIFYEVKTLIIESYERGDHFEDFDRQYI
jgi:hypothetical protein